MINLLPPSNRKQLAAARTNRLLLRYVIILGCCIGCLLLEIGATYYILDSTKKNNQAIIDDNDKKAAAYASTKTSADQFRSNLTAAKQILSQQFPYTTALISLAQLLPAGTVIDTININPQSFGTPTTLSVDAVSAMAAVQAKQNFEQSPLFSNVSFQSLTNQPKTTSGYPYIAMYNVTFSKGAFTK